MKAFVFGLGLVIFSLGLSTVTGYALRWTPLYRWDEGTGMALNTGLTFMLTGLSITILASRSHNHRQP